ncbi:hypothetical protein [Streptomyces tibetensis]|uniref:hypothetical protein n=1 Tax=Streptomyces tibetensis TaxID=2382123 RepID=UPI0033EA5255
MPEPVNRKAGPPQRRADRGCAAFERITQGWPEEERLEFARLLIKYVDFVSELQQEPGSA